MVDELGVGGLIQELRGVLGMSQSQLADRLCVLAGRATVTREQVSRWENGGRTPKFWLPYLATVLEVPIAALEDPVERRKFLSGVVATTIAPAIASELLSDGFASALSGGPNIDTWFDKVEQYGLDYMTLGAPEIQKRLTTDMLVIQQQFDDPRMWAVAARLMVLYGKTFPGSDGGKAAQWYRNAAVAADRSGDVDTRVWVRGRASLALGYEGASLGLAKSLGEQAIHIGTGRPVSNGTLNAVWALAHIAALRGDPATAVTTMEEAKRAFDKAGSEDPTDYAIPWWRHNVHISLLAARLGHEDVADKAQDDAHKTIPESMPRFHTHLKMHKGLMLVRAGDRDGGIEAAQKALDELPPEKHSLTLRLLMEEIRA